MGMERCGTVKVPVICGGYQPILSIFHGIFLRPRSSKCLGTLEIGGKRDETGRNPF